ncbi:hypothetical protein PMAYCL1PPCAC_06434, partial [Pristionchus mayeri]
FRGLPPTSSSSSAALLQPGGEWLVMTVNYSKTRYAVREEWEKKGLDEETKKKLHQGLLSGTRYSCPPGPASQNVAESLDLSHYLHTTIFTSIENGWHYDKSISYDAMMVRNKEKKWERAELHGIRHPGKPLFNKFFDGARKWKEWEARWGRMQEGKAYSNDEDAMEIDLRERNGQRRDEECCMEYSLDQLTGEVLPGSKRGMEIGLTSGPIPLRPNIRGEELKAAPPVDESEEKIHWTDLIGFPHSTKFACFYISGEPHIAIPQMLEELGMGYGPDWERLASTWEKLGIKAKKATGRQVKALKKERAINRALLKGTDVPIQLMRKSDASRILGEYLPLEENQNENPKLSCITPEMEGEAVEVEHECQGFAKGKMYTSGYVKCEDCSKIFKPDSFVCHSHIRTETEKVCHWGFNPRRWRDYINLWGKDRRDPEKIKRFNQIISEPIAAEFCQKESKTWRVSEGSISPRKSVLVPLNRSFNRRPPSPLVVGAESTGRLPQKRTGDEDEEVEEEETVHEKTPEQQTIEVIDNEIQIIEAPLLKSKEFRKDDNLFKAPDINATPLSRKYAEKAGKSKGFDLEGILPDKLQHLQDPFASLLRFPQPEVIPVFAASIASNPNGFLPIKEIFDFISTQKGNKLEEESLEKPSKTVDSPTSELSPLHHTSSALVPYLKEHHAVVPSPSSPSAFLPCIKHTDILKKYEDRQHMARKLDDDLVELLQKCPGNLGHQIAEVVKSRDQMRDANIVDWNNEVVTTRTRDKDLETAVKRASFESEYLYKICKEKQVSIPPIALPDTSLQQLAPIPPILKPFSLPPSSQPLSILPPSASSAPPSSSHQYQLNGGRSLSLSSSIGINRPSSMLNQPGPAYPSLASSSPVARPVQQPQRVGQRGRPRGSTNANSAYKKQSNAVHQAAEAMNLQRQMDHQKMQQQQLHLNALQQLRQQQALTAAQASPLGLLNGGNNSVTSSSSNPLAPFGIPVSLSSLLTSPLPSSSQQLQSQTEFSGLSEAAALMARVQMSSSSSAAYPSIPSTPSNGIPLPTTSTQDVQSILEAGMAENVRMMLLQSLSENQRHQQLLQSSPVPLPPQQPSPAPPPAGMVMNGTPMIDLDLVRGMLTNPSLIPEGFTMEQIRAFHDTIAFSTESRMQ